MKHAPLKADGTLTFSAKDGKHAIGHHVHVESMLKNIAQMRELESMATRQSNPNGWQRIGSAPEPVLHKWLKDRGYSMHHYAANAGGSKIRPGQDPYHWIRTDPGVKASFWRWFTRNRDFAKLHNTHVTTKRESSQILVPSTYRSKPE